MSQDRPKSNMNRRAFMKTSTAAVAGSALLSTDSSAAFTLSEDGLDHRNERTDRMQYRQLGRTKFMASRLAFGCGAALAGGKAVHMLEHAFEAGINFYDSSSNRAYKGTEAALAPFLKKHRDEIWVSSKSVARVPRGKPLTQEIARDAAQFWLKTLDQSLVNFGVDQLDSYYLLGVWDPGIVRNEELYHAFLQAKQAGKVRHFGFSTHENAQECLEAAIDVGWYSLAMVAVTPGGWYDLKTRNTLEARGTLRDLRPLFDRARDAGMGVIGMKAGRFIAAAKTSGESNTAAFDKHYGERLASAPISPFQRSYAYVLENGLDIVNADMQNMKHFEENVYAARTSNTYFA